MKRISFILFALLWAILLIPASCVREVVMDAGEKPTVVVECVISNTSPQTLHLRYTKGAAKEYCEVVTEAEAVLLDLTDGSEAGRFVKAEDGVWTLDYEAIDEHEYRLEVSVPGYDLITAEQQMPLRPDVRAIRNSSCSPSFTPDTFADTCEWTRSCYYRLYAENNEPGSLWVYAMNYDNETGRRELAEYICCDGNCDDFNLTDSVYATKTDTVVHKIPGRLYAESLLSGIYPQLVGCTMHDRYLRLLTRPEALKVSGSFNGFYPVKFTEDWEVENDGVISEPADDQGYLVFANISEEYEIYHVESFYFQQIDSSSILSDIYLRDNVFTNINGGLGIFGAKAETKMVWSEKPEIYESCGYIDSPF